jgi:multidrug efflux pump subunit AcrA (membrane-fusion protein)
MKAANGLAVALLAAGSLWLSSCGGHDDHEKAHGSGPEVAVSVAQVTDAPGGGSASVPQGGVAEEVTLTARAQGHLTALPRNEGESFRYGDALARFESEENRAAIEAGREALEAAKVSLEYAERQWQRMVKLQANRVASERELENARSEFESSQARYAGANADYEKLLKSVTLAAPFDGVVVLHRVDPGTIVSPGQPILHIRSLSTSGNAVPESGGTSLWVPTAALIHRGGLTGVFVVKENHAVLRWIRTGQTAGDHQEVLSGLSQGESVVLEPGQLTDGQPVRVDK